MSCPVLYVIHDRLLFLLDFKTLMNHYLVRMAVLLPKARSSTKMAAEWSERLFLLFCPPWTVIGRPRSQME
jgi:hypothetical protein